MKLWNVSFDFVAVILILALPFVEFVHTNIIIFDVVTVYILAGYAAAALAITLLINTYPNRIFRSVIFTTIIILFLDARVDIVRQIGLQTWFVAIGLLVAIWLVHKKTPAILVAVFGGIFVGVFFIEAFPKVHEYPTAHPTNGGQTTDLPVYVHIILDEYIGLEALDESIDAQKDLKRSAHDLFINNGFRLFGRAYAEYYDTYDSLSAAFNSYRGLDPGIFYQRDISANEYTLTENKYLRDLHSSGYNVQIYQNSFLNYCGPLKNIIQRCLTYSSFNISGWALEQLDTGEKLDVILSKFGFVYSRTTLHQAYTKVAATAARFGITLPTWYIPPPSDLGPIPVLPVFDQLISDIVDTPKGTLFFAHLLLPHSTYSVDQACNIRGPAASWKTTELLQPLSDGRINTARSYAEKYEDYIDQSQCALVMLDRLIQAMRSAGIYDNAIIIIHGDHGSRITRFKPRSANQNKLVAQDYYDGFSTLFAVKAPHITPGYDLQMLPLERLLRLAEGDLSAIAEPADEHFVYLREALPPSSVIKVPMPEIPGG